MKGPDSVARLGALLPWINGWPVADVAVKRLLQEFIDSFDGGESSGYVAVGGPEVPDHVLADPTPTPPSPVPQAEEDEIFETRLMLETLLETGFGPAKPVPPAFAQFVVVPEGGFAVETNLSISMRSANRARPTSKSLQAGTEHDRRRARRQYRAEKKQYGSAGAYVLQVDGPRRHLVPFLVGHLLTMPGAARVTRCQGLTRDSTERCNAFLISAGRGAPPKYCSSACGTRLRAEKEQQDRVSAGTAGARRRRKR